MVDACKGAFEFPSKTGLCWIVVQNVLSWTLAWLTDLVCSKMLELVLLAQEQIKLRGSGVGKYPQGHDQD